LTNSSARNQRQNNVVVAAAAAVEVSLHCGFCATGKRALNEGRMQRGAICLIYEIIIFVSFAPNTYCKYLNTFGLEFLFQMNSLSVLGLAQPISAQLAGLLSTICRPASAIVFFSFWVSSFSCKTMQIVPSPDERKPFDGNEKRRKQDDSLKAIKT
jgi:hypothetical protein